MIGITGTIRKCNGGVWWMIALLPPLLFLLLLLLLLPWDNHRLPLVDILAGTGEYNWITVCRHWGLSDQTDCRICFKRDLCSSRHHHVLLMVNCDLITVSVSFTRSTVTLGSCWFDSLLFHYYQLFGSSCLWSDWHCASHCVHCVSVSVSLIQLAALDF